MGAFSSNVFDSCDESVRVWENVCEGGRFRPICPKTESSMGSLEGQTFQSARLLPVLRICSSVFDYLIDTLIDTLQIFNRVPYEGSTCRLCPPPWCALILHVCVQNLASHQQVFREPCPPSVRSLAWTLAAAAAATCPA